MIIIHHLTIHHHPSSAMTPSHHYSSILQPYQECLCLASFYGPVMETANPFDNAEADWNTCPFRSSCAHRIMYLSVLLYFTIHSTDLPICDTHNAHIMYLSVLLYSTTHSTDLPICDTHNVLISPSVFHNTQHCLANMS